ncbi:MAG: hypothetical protein R3A45_06365 [Bdellovibrionota bacterium]
MTYFLLSTLPMIEKLFAPAMNSKMLENSAVQTRLTYLKMQEVSFWILLLGSSPVKKSDLAK